MTDRFRPDAAVRRVVPQPVRASADLSGRNTPPPAVSSAKLIGLLDDPKIAAAVRVPGEDRPLPTPPVEGPVVVEFRQSGGQIAELFEERGPIAHRGRRSIPHSYRGEGRNFVD